MTDYKPTQWWYHDGAQWVNVQTARYDSMHGPLILARHVPGVPSVAQRLRCWWRSSGSAWRNGVLQRLAWWTVGAAWGAALWSSVFAPTP